MSLLAAILITLAPAQADDDLARRATAVKPTERELTWQKIPWVLDLMEARRMAKAENRPIFLWATGDDPLERC